MDETGQQAAFDEDPAAAFLAREQDELADIAEDTLGFTPGASEEFTGQGPAMTGSTGEGIPNDVDLFGTATDQPPQEPVMLSSDPYAAFSQMDQVSSEPECIRKWREEQAEMLAQKDAEEAAALEDLRAQARKELSEWYSRNDDQLNQTKISNRQAEAALVEERDEDVPGHEWERVARLCDFNPKNSKNTKDVGRMRSIFLQLKQTPLVRD